MRQYVLHPDDTLRSIARDTYYVYNDQGDEDENRVALVVREILKRNKNIRTLFSPPDKLIALQSNQLAAIVNQPLKFEDDKY